MIERDRHDHHFVGAIVRGERLESWLDRRRRPDEPPPPPAERVDLSTMLDDELQRGLDGRYGNQLALQKQRERHPAAGGEAVRFLVAVRAQRPCGADDARLRMLSRPD